MDPNTQTPTQVVNTNSSMHDRAGIMMGFTAGAGFGLILLAGYIVGSKPGDSGVPAAGFIMGAMLIIVSTVWYFRYKKSK